MLLFNQFLLSSSCEKLEANFVLPQLKAVSLISSFLVWKKSRRKKKGHFKLFFESKCDSYQNRPKEGFLSWLLHKFCPFIRLSFRWEKARAVTERGRNRVASHCPLHSLSFLHLSPCAFLLPPPSPLSSSKTKGFSPPYSSSSYSSFSLLFYQLVFTADRAIY